jgi:hypothetical protein
MSELEATVDVAERVVDLLNSAKSRRIDNTLMGLGSDPAGARHDARATAAPRGVSARPG